MIAMSSSITDGCAFQVLDVVQGENLSVAGYQYAQIAQTHAKNSHLFELRNNNDLSMRENSPKFVYMRASCIMPVSQLRLDG